MNGKNYNTKNLNKVINEKLKTIEKGEISKRIEVVHEQVKELFEVPYGYEFRISVTHIWNTQFNSYNANDSAYGYDEEYSFFGTYEEWQEHLKDYDFEYSVEYYNVLSEKIEFSLGAIGYSVVYLWDKY